MGSELQDTDHEAGLNFVDCYLDGVQAGEMDPTHIVCSTEARFLLGHNKKNKLTKNSMLMHTVPCEGIMCAVLLV